MRSGIALLADFIRRKVFHLAGVVLTLLLAVMAALWPAAAQAFAANNITFPVPPSGVASGTSLLFSVAINLGTGEYVPIQSISLYIFKVNSRATNQASCVNLPLSSATTLYSEADTGGGRVNIVATAGPNWNYRPIQGGYGPGPTSLRYDVIWDIPTAWLSGTCQAEVKVTTSYGTFSRVTDEFPIFVLPLGAINIAQYTNGAGVFLQSVQVSSADGWAWMDIAKGNKALVRGQLLSEMSIIIIQNTLLPPLPPDTATVGRAYNFGPEETTFSQPVTLRLRYDPADMPAGADEKNLVVATWNTAGSWDMLPSSVDTANHWVAAQVDHFSIFRVLTPTLPAAFTITNLSISPATVNAGKPATVSVTANNTGDLSGTCTIMVKIDDVPVTSQDVTLAGRTGQKVTFSISRDIPGVYTLTVNGLVGTLTVTPAPPPPSPTPKPSPTAVPTPSPTPAPKPSPTLTPTAKPAPSAASPVPLPPKTGWWPSVRVIAIVSILLGAGIWLIVSSFRK